MYSVSDEYIEMMNAGVRKPSYMKIIFSFEAGDVTFINDDIVSFKESKTAHLVAGELPTIEASIELKNLTGLFDGDDETNKPNYHDQIVEGVKVIYYFGYQGKSRVKPYGYDGDSSDTYDPVYGMSDSDTPQYTYYTDDGYETIPAEAYGFADGYDIVWIKGGEVYTDGDIEFDESAISATISAYDALSVLSDTVYYSFSGSTTLGEIAENVIGLTDYPEDDNGDKKIIIGDELYDISTSISVAGIPSDSTSAKEWLQDIAYAGCVQMYIDRDGYLHLDKDQEEISPSQYTLYAFNQSENPSYYKYQLPRSLTIEMDSDYVEDIETNIGGGGEELVVSNNPYIVTTTSGERLEDRLVNDFIPYRNEADITYRGEPALDILDRITFEKSTGTTLTGTIIESTLNFDGGIEGTLLIRYTSDSTTPSVKIKGGDMFYYPVDSDTPTVDDITLTCNTTAESATYQWYYFDSGKWYTIDNTTTTLIIGYDDVYFDHSDSVKFKCIVNDYLGAYTTVSKYYYEEVAEAGYKGEVKGTTVEDIKEVIEKPVVGDVVLLDNTADVEAEEYGKAYVYNGDTWVVTEDSSYLSDVYKDALELAVQSGETIYSAKTYTDLLVANEAFISSLSADEAFITNLMTNNLLIEEGGSIHSDYYNSDGSVNNDSGAKSGVYMDSSGNLKAENAEFTNTSVSGKFTSDSLVTFDAKSNITSEWGLSQHLTTSYSFISGGDGRISDDSTADIYGAAYGNGKYVVCGDRSYVYYSTDLTTWTSQELNSDLESFASVCFDNNLFVLVGGEGHIYTSSDGVTWTLRYTDSNHYWNKVKYINNLFVVVGDGGVVGSSSDGITWTLTTASKYHLSGIAYGNGKYVAVGPRKYIYYSTDLTTWTESASGSTKYLYGIEYANDVFIMVGENGYVARSTDGITWTNGQELQRNRFFNVEYINNTFVIMGRGGYYYYSSDGKYWSDGVAFGNDGDDIRAMFKANNIGIVVGYDTYFSTLTVTSMYSVSQIYDYLSDLLDNLVAPSGETLPTVEPLFYTSYVTGTLTWESVTYNLTSMKVSGNAITFNDGTSNYTIDLETYAFSDLIISGLSITGASEENQVTSITPKNGNSTGNVGSDGNRFANGYFDNIEGTNLTIDDINGVSATLNSLSLDSPNTFSDGYVIMPNGLIIQWGTLNVTQDTKKTYTFLVDFSETPSLSTGSNWAEKGNRGWTPCGGYAISTRQFSLWNTDVFNAVQWMAIGY